jgi:hypothetical protein
MGEPGAIVVLVDSAVGRVGSLNHAHVIGLAIAEAGDFIHIKPDTIELHLFIEVGQTQGPNILGARMEPIKEDIILLGSSIDTVEFGPNLGSNGVA